MLQLALLVVAFVGSCLGSMQYRRFAMERGIVAKLNSRTLHEKIVPRGGGVVFAGIFSLAIVVIWLLGELSTGVMLCFGLGGAAAAASGFIDDVHDVRAVRKLLIQLGLAAWMLITFTSALYRPLVSGSLGVWEIVLAAVLLFVPVWLINLYNFIDGIDGLAISGAVFICAAAILVLVLTGGDTRYVFLFALLAAAGLGFLLFNMPPASMFMGDAGSIFLGYCFSALVLSTVLSGQISVWTWLCILGYYLADTTTTTLTRMVLVERWYHGHRSHAYQNLARIWRSHAKVTYGILLYNVAWALPLAVWSAYRPEWAPLAAALSLLPPVLWTMRFGPRLSSD